MHGDVHGERMDRVDVAVATAGFPAVGGKGAWVFRGSGSSRPNLWIFSSGYTCVSADIFRYAVDM